MDLPRQPACKHRASLLAATVCALTLALVNLAFGPMRGAAPEADRTGLWLGAVQRGKGKTNRVWSVGVSDEGRWFACGSVDRTERLEDAATGHERRALTRHTRSVWSLSSGPEGRWLPSWSQHETVRTRGHARAGVSVLGETAGRRPE